METNHFSISKKGIGYAIYTAIGLIGYFLLMKVLGLLHILELRFLNFFILAAGVWLAERNYRRKIDGSVDYLKGFGLGIFVSFISTAIFSVFLYIYLTNFDPNFMTYLQSAAPMGSFLDPSVAAFGIMMEGTASGAVLTLLSLQYYRRKSHHHKSEFSHRYKEYPY